MKSTESLVPLFDGTPRTTYQPKNRKKIPFGVTGFHPNEVRREQLSDGALIRAIRSAGSSTSFSIYNPVGGWQIVKTSQPQQLPVDVQQFIAQIEPSLLAEKIA